MQSEYQHRLFLQYRFVIGFDCDENVELDLYMLVMGYSNNKTVSVANIYNSALFCLCVIIAPHSNTASDKTLLSVSLSPSSLPFLVSFIFKT